MEQLSLFSSFKPGDCVSFDSLYPCLFSAISVGDLFVHYHWRSDPFVVLRCDEIIFIDGHARLVCFDGSCTPSLIDDIRGYIPDHFCFIRE